jgi:hypothetical protein
VYRAGIAGSEDGRARFCAPGMRGGGNDLSRSRVVHSASSSANLKGTWLYWTKVLSRESIWRSSRWRRGLTDQPKFHSLLISFFALTGLAMHSLDFTELLHFWWHNKLTRLAFARHWEQIGVTSCAWRWNEV